MEEKEVLEIEKRLVKSALSKLDVLPRKLRREISRAADTVMAVWKIDSVYYGEIQVKIFQSVANSTMTMEWLSQMINLHGEKLKGKSFDRFLKRMKKESKIQRRREVKNGSTE